MRIPWQLEAVFLAVSCIAPLASAGAQRPAYQSPYGVVMAPDGSRLYVSHHTGGAVSIVDPKAGKVVGRIAVGGTPAGLALSPDGKTLYVADAASGFVAVADAQKGAVTGKLEAGRSAWGLALSPDGKTLYVCDRFLNRVAVVDLVARKAARFLPATREPLFCALTPDGKTLCVANMLPLGPATDPDNAAAVDLVDAASAKRLATIPLPAGGTDVHQIVCSPDGKWAYVVHVLGRFNIAPTQLERGWVNNSCLTIVDLAKREVLASLLLDEVSQGHAVPFAAVLTPDGKTLAVSYTGTHDLALINLPKLHEALAKEPQERLPKLVNELSLLRRYGVIRRAPAGGQGPRAIAIAPDGKTLYVANYYSDDLGVVDIERGRLERTIALGPRREPDTVRRGEMLFHDATICFQHWQSCATCHPDGRVDALNWDLLNDGIGNPKNVRTMLDAHRTPPVMSSGIRATAEIAVRAGLRYILFHQVDEAEAKPIDEYLKSLQPLPSPFRNRDGSLTAAAKRGKLLFESRDVGCSYCHNGKLLTDLKLHDVGTRGPLDRRDTFDNPSLREAWRTGPYLHDGRAVSLRDVLTAHNKGDKHGRTSRLSPKQIDDLAAYLRSL